MNVKILIASHRPYWMPEDALYLPVQAGAAGDNTIPDFQRDDEGENISSKNSHYCELTALYWGWKNLDCEYLGLAHYRRHFKGSGERGTLAAEDLCPLLAKAPVVLPKRRHYVVETVESHYGHTFDPFHIEGVRLALNQSSPEYLDSFNTHMNKRSSHMWNMAIMRRDILDAYCSWLFGVLELVDAGLDYSGMDAFQARAVGRLAERLLDPWLDHNGIPYAEVGVVEMERVNWLHKGASFLGAKFLGRRYTESF